MATTNEQVKQAFRNGKMANSANLMSTGESLLSYGWWQVAKWKDGSIVTRKGRAYSMTTATKHRPGIGGVEAQEETPVGQSYMND
jgi:hypothetical protein